MESGTTQETCGFFLHCLEVSCDVQTIRYLFVCFTQVTNKCISFTLPMCINTPCHLRLWNS